MTIYDDYLGEGYAIPTQLSRRTLYEFARTEGILLEHVYTSKCVGGFLDLIQKGIIPPDEGACYIHTGGLASIFTSTIDTLLSWC
jgi:1-aminocyclopropane-1-carboxylate deaminase/D-cysteine desulfhydrase-like pyridoxal-dependent ACC family enzyme